MIPNLSEIPQLIVPSQDGVYRFIQLYARKVGLSVPLMRFGQEKEFPSARLVKKTLEDLGITKYDTLGDSRLDVPFFRGKEYNIVSVGRCELDGAKFRVSIEDDSYSPDCFNLDHFKSLNHNSLLYGYGKCSIEVVPIL